MPDVIYEKRDFYALFTMNRPERLNAQSLGLQQEMEEAVADFNDDVHMRVGILTGAGRAFCAGADLKEMAERVGAQDESYTDWDETIFLRSPKPFIAAINGLAIGGGLEYALDCDIRICSAEAYFGLFEVRRGIAAGYAWYHLPRVIDMAAANYVLLTGERISAEQALQFGIVTEVVEPDRLMPRAVEIAGLIRAERAAVRAGHEGGRAHLAHGPAGRLGACRRPGDRDDHGLRGRNRGPDRLRGEA